ncbi:MAG: hypothetical protein PUF62_10860, partial [Bacteroidales bacterium]|nr:hypothetical protein [Bacteroidales bacterium]
MYRTNYFTRKVGLLIAILCLCVSFTAAQDEEWLGIDRPPRTEFKMEKQNGLLGVRNHKGKLVVPCKYHKLRYVPITYISNYRYFVAYNEVLKQTDLYTSLGYKIISFAGNHLSMYFSEHEGYPYFYVTDKKNIHIYDGTGKLMLTSPGFLCYIGGDGGHFYYEITQNNVKKSLYYDKDGVLILKGKSLVFRPKGSEYSGPSPFSKHKDELAKLFPVASSVSYAKADTPKATAPRSKAEDKKVGKTWTITVPDKDSQSESSHRHPAVVPSYRLVSTSPSGQNSSKSSAPINIRNRYRDNDDVASSNHTVRKAPDFTKDADQERVASKRGGDSSETTEVIEKANRLANAGSVKEAATLLSEFKNAYASGLSAADKAQLGLTMMHIGTQLGYASMTSDIN